MREHRCELSNNSRLKEEIFKRFKRKQKIGNKIALDFITAVLKVKKDNGVFLQNSKGK